MSPLLLVVFLNAGPSAPPPPPPPPAGDECFPTCRAGYFCHQSQCVSACNPGCGAGDVCTPAGQCVPRGSHAADAPLATSTGPVINTEGEHAPRGQHWETKRSRGLIMAGALTGGITWIISVIAAVFSYDNTTFFPASNGQVVQKESAYILYAIPLVGPIVGRATLTTKYGSSLSGGVDWLFAVGSSVAQMAGLTMAVLGARQTEQLADDNAYASRSSEPVPVRLALSPGAAGAPMGFTFTLTH